MALIDNADLLNQIFQSFVPCEESKTDADGRKRYKKPKLSNWQKSKLSFDSCVNELHFGGVVKNGMVCIDCDNDDSANMLLRICDNYKLNVLVVKTVKGLHFYLKDTKKLILKNDVGAILPINAVVDYRCGGNGFVVLKEFGIERDIIRIPNGELDEIPMYFVAHHVSKPIKDASPKLLGGEKYNFPLLANSEDWSLHNTLRDYMLVLASNGYKNDENIKTIIRSINKGMLNPESDKIIESSLLNDFAKVHEITTNHEFRNIRNAQGETCKNIGLAIKYYNDLNVYKNYIAYKSGRGLFEIYKDSTGVYNESMLKFSVLKSKLTTSAFNWISGETKDGVPIYEQPSDNTFKSFCDAGEQDLKTTPIYKNIVNGAFLTKEGRLVNKFGLDNTGVFLTRDVPVPTIPKNPSVDDIAHAKAIIMNVLNEFAFEMEDGETLENNVNYQNSIFCLITAIFRPAWVGATPMFIFSKPSERLGASLLSDVISRLSFSNPASVSSVSTREDENEKIVQSLIIGNPCYQVLDNVVKNNWVTPTLLTCSSGAGSFSFRQLGTSRTIVAERSTLWVINGINVNLSADITGRVVLTKMSTANKSWQNMRFTRTRDELLRLAESEHPNVIWSVGVILNNWINNHGRPCPPKLNGNFSEFASLYDFVGGMMHSAGYNNVLGNIAQIQEEENEAEITGAKLIKVLLERFPDGTFTTSDIINQMKTEAFQHVSICDYDYDMDISSILLNESEIKMVDNISTTKVGTLLSQYLNRTFTNSTHKLIKIKVMGQRMYKLASI